MMNTMVNDSESPVERRRNHFFHFIEKEMGLNLNQVATRANIQVSSLRQYRRGDSRSLNTATYEKIARALNTTVAYLQGEISPPSSPSGASASRADPESGWNSRPPEAPAASGQRIPIYGRIVGGTGGRFYFDGPTLGEVRCLPLLEYVPGAYAVYVSGECMEPRYFSGEVIYVNPAKPPRRGDFVVIQVKPESLDESPSGLIRRLKCLGPEIAEFEQLNPLQSLCLPTEQILGIDLIVGSAAG